jgi:hypothetical protein
LLPLSCTLILQIHVAMYKYVRFQVSTAASMKFRVFWSVAPLVTFKLTDVSEVRTASTASGRIAGKYVIGVCCNGLVFV